jgi:ankyrin repeat protein
MLYGSFLDIKEYVRCHPNEIDKFIDDNEEINPLMFAIKYNLTKAALYLIEKGANINLADKYNMSTLMFAVRTNSFELCKKLLDTNKELVNLVSRII